MTVSASQTARKRLDPKNAVEEEVREYMVTTLTDASRQGRNENVA